jgi:hypothetical protein
MHAIGDQFVGRWVQGVEDAGRAVIVDVHDDVGGLVVVGLAGAQGRGHAGFGHRVTPFRAGEKGVGRTAATACWVVAVISTNLGIGPVRIGRAGPVGV